MKRQRRIARAATLTALLLLLGSTLAWGGEVNKCVDAQGKASYSDKPCPAGETSEAVRASTSTPAVVREPVILLTPALREQCDAAQQAIREKTVPIADVEKVKLQLRQCATVAYLEMAIEAKAQEDADAKARQAQIASMTPECQALWKEVTTLQTTIQTPEEIQHYIRRSDAYERICKK